MDNNNRNGASGGIGLSGILTIVFIVLKLTGVISWGWQWVLSPIWITAIIVIVIIFVLIKWGKK